ncbi:MAG: apbE 1 [Bacteroidetes bacterium]|nr:apbE 1 [Bacteroidota bacterium]
MDNENACMTFGDKPADGILRYSHHAMATVFEVFVYGEDPVYARQAAYEAFQEVDRLEQELSRYIPNSDISCLNALAPSGEMLLGPNAFDCLSLALRYSTETNGAFDVTVGALMNVLLTRDKQLKKPVPEEILQAKARTGMHHLLLNGTEQSVKVLDVVPQVDLGAIGKGYAVDRMIALLKEWDVANVLVHGGTSSVFARGALPGRAGWPVTLSSPGSPDVVLARLDIAEHGLGGSGVKKGRHIIDPRTGTPVPGGRAAWVQAESATCADAISTACMVMAKKEIAQLCETHPQMQVLLVETAEGGREEVSRYGFPSEGDASARLTAKIS